MGEIGPDTDFKPSECFSEYIFIKNFLCANQIKAVPCSSPTGEVEACVNLRALLQNLREIKVAENMKDYAGLEDSFSAEDLYAMKQRKFEDGDIAQFNLDFFGEAT